MFINISFIKINKQFQRSTYIEVDHARLNYLSGIFLIRKFYSTEHTVLYSRIINDNMYGTM